jgi:hypothetical protein
MYNLLEGHPRFCKKAMPINARYQCPHACHFNKFGITIRVTLLALSRLQKLIERAAHSEIVIMVLCE